MYSCKTIIFLKFFPSETIFYKSVKILDTKKYATYRVCLVYFLTSTIFYLSKKNFLKRFFFLDIRFNICYKLLLAIASGLDGESLYKIMKLSLSSFLYRNISSYGLPRALRKLNHETLYMYFACHQNKVP
jgi:hypothetical protein